jgi:DNA-directed RNA polymerase specialized sigma24 family protein
VLPDNPGSVPSRQSLPAQSGHDPDLWLYRERTLGILRRYQRLSIESGRLPSLLGREFFRTRVTTYHAGTFEDAVIFVHDVARGLKQLGAFEHKLIAKIALQDYTQNETARVLGCRRRTVGRRFPEALDQMTDIFLAAGLLVRLPVTDVARAENCQEGEIDEIAVSDSEHGK